MEMNNATAREFVRAMDAMDTADAVESEANLDALGAINFCGDIWPTAKHGLEVLRDSVFTGSGPQTIVVRWAINTIIRVVDGRCG